MDWERALICKIIDTKDLRTVIRQKITKDFFYTTQGKGAFIYLMAYYANPAYADTPSRESFLHDMTNFDWLSCDDSIVAICDKLRTKKKYNDITSLMDQVGDATLADADGGFEVLKKLTSQLTVEHTIDQAVDITSRVDEMKADYIRMKEMVGQKLRGKPYPWPTMNKATLGLQDGQLVLIYGRPKTRKTWALMECLKSFHENGAKILMFSQQLPVNEIQQRAACLSCAVNYGKVLTGSLSIEQESDYFANLDAFKENPGYIVDQISGKNEDALTELIAKVEDLKPTIVAIDEIQACCDDWRDVEKFLTGVKQFLIRAGIPMIATTHANRAGATKPKKGEKPNYMGDGSDFAAADAFAKYCDVAIKSIIERSHAIRHEQVLAIQAIRQGIPLSCTINSRLCEDMTEKHENIQEDADRIDEPMDNDGDMQGADALCQLTI